MDEWRIIEGVFAALLIAGSLATIRWLRASVKHRTEIERKRAADVVRLLQYHEGTPANQVEGIPAVPSIQERFERLEAQVTPNGGDTDTLGDRVERTQQLAEQGIQQQRTLRDLAQRHIDDHMTLMEIREMNDRALHAVLEAAGIDLPEYIEAPEEIRTRNRDPLDDALDWDDPKS